MGPALRADVTFLFLGETLLIPHLYPIVEALAEMAPDILIDMWVSTSVHEALLDGWLADQDRARIRIRRAPGFRLFLGEHDGRNPQLPAKLPMLARLAPRLALARVVVSAEQTSLWLPALLPLRSRFVNTLHGAGSMMNRGDRRRRAAWRTLVAADRERRALASFGVDPATIAVTGYVKAGFRQRTMRHPCFADERPILLYAPHWQRHRSSWWRWGPEAVRQVIASGRYNLLFAPHQRLVDRAPEVRSLVEKLFGRRDVHCDLDSFATVDGSYTAAADLYLGDTSSQVVEFLMTPRPCVFLDAQKVTWEGDPSYEMWKAGEVVTDIGALLPALARATELHPGFAAAQAAFAKESLGDVSGAGPRHAAAEILAALRSDGRALSQSR